ncbi:hypothetical protein [Rhodococcus sp. 11-3]|uniref:hypothetical protein n=1 Tax=Rhodococcus sp. 11-3 TaxID=2854796 RepID=UPI00203A8727|nr:hypothetical protein [Rhodococcus sp. 11-3]USC17036.1 hypothetical protein KZJ41_09290 [Rhodococcus sp. 11-3]
MASLQNIRKAIARVLENNIDFDVFCYENVADMHHFPAIIIEPDKADYVFNRGAMVTWRINLFVVESRADVESAQSRIDELIDSAGDNSIIEILLNNAELGFTDGTDVTPIYMKGYGGNFKDSGVPHVGAVLQIEVITDARVR